MFLRKIAAGILLVSTSWASCKNAEQDDNVVYPVKGHKAYDNQIVQPYTQAILQDEDNAELFVQRAAALKNINCDTLAIIDLKRAVTLDSLAYDYQIMLGELLNENNLPHQAITYFDQVIKHDPQIPAFLGRLKSLILMSRYPEAHEMVKEMNTKIPQHPDLKYLEFELLLSDQKDTSAALSQMRDFLNQFPLAINIKMLQAEMELAINDAQVVKTYQELFLTDTLDAYPHEKIGDYYRQNKDFDKAMASYRQSVRTDLNYYYGFYKIAQLYQEYDSLDKALVNYSIAKDINPAYAPAYEGMVVIFQKKGQYDSAEVYKKIALRLDPKLQFKEQ